MATDTRPGRIREQEEMAALAARVEQQALPLEGPQDLDPLLDRIGNAHYVLLGEASHGTSEFYLWRATLTRRLIEEKGFSFVAVEGDWPDCYCLNRYVKDYSDCGTTAREALGSFRRWPTWMWANWETAAMADWLRRYNAGRTEKKKIGFFGLDVYSLWESLHAVIGYLRTDEGAAAEAARRALRCFEPFAEDPGRYGRATDALVPTTCEREAVELLQTMRRQAPTEGDGDYENRFVAEQNALVVKNAESYYRAMMRGGPESWNVRDHHMVETLNRLMAFHGSRARCVVWEHNTHVGDARATGMAAQGMVNVGQLVREQHQVDEVFTVGFSSYSGSVIAGEAWDAPMQKMDMPGGRAGSWEEALHLAGAHDKLLLLNDVKGDPAFMEPRGHRAIGVVYDPEYEAWGNYVPTVLPDRYDALLYIERSHALHPLHLEPHLDGEPPDTYPWKV